MNLGPTWSWVGTRTRKWNLPASPCCCWLPRLAIFKDVPLGARTEICGSDGRTPDPFSGSNQG
jgi:hypothetical protein